MLTSFLNMNTRGRPFAPTDTGGGILWSERHVRKSEKIVGV